MEDRLALAAACKVTDTDNPHTLGWNLGRLSVWAADLGAGGAA